MSRIKSYSKERNVMTHLILLHVLVDRPALSGRSIAARRLYFRAQYSDSATDDEIVPRKASNITGSLRH